MTLRTCARSHRVAGPRGLRWRRGEPSRRLHRPRRHHDGRAGGLHVPTRLSVRGRGSDDHPRQHRRRPAHLHRDRNRRGSRGGRGDLRRREPVGRGRPAPTPSPARSTRRWRRPSPSREAQNPSFSSAFGSRLPLLDDLHPEIEEHLGAEQQLHLLARARADRAERLRRPCRSRSPSANRARRSTTRRSS